MAKPEAELTRGLFDPAWEFSKGGYDYTAQLVDLEHHSRREKSRSPVIFYKVHHLRAVKLPIDEATCDTLRREIILKLGGKEMIEKAKSLPEGWIWNTGKGLVVTDDLRVMGITGNSWNCDLPGPMPKGFWPSAVTDISFELELIASPAWKKLILEPYVKLRWAVKTLNLTLMRLSETVKTPMQALKLFPQCRAFIEKPSNVPDRTVYRASGDIEAMRKLVFEWETSAQVKGPTEEEAREAASLVLLLMERGTEQSLRQA